MHTFTQADCPWRAAALNPCSRPPSEDAVERASERIHAIAVLARVLCLQGFAEQALHFAGRAVDDARLAAVPALLCQASLTEAYPYLVCGSFAKASADLATLLE